MAQFKAAAAFFCHIFSNSVDKITGIRVVSYLSYLKNVKRIKKEELCH